MKMVNTKCFSLQKKDLVIFNFIFLSADLPLMLNTVCFVKQDVLIAVFQVKKDQFSVLGAYFAGGSNLLTGYD